MPMFAKIPPGITKKQNKTPPPDTGEIAKLSLSPSLLAVDVGGTVYATLTARDVFGLPVELPGSGITIYVSSGGKATVGRSGALVGITGIAAGTAQIYARLDRSGFSPLLSNTIQATISITEDVTPATITVSPSSFSLDVDQTRHIDATIRNAAGTPILGLVPTSWTVADDTIADVDGNGLVTALAEGSTTVTAHYNSFSASSTITVEAGANSDVLEVQLPQTFLTTSVASTPSTGRVVNCVNTAQFQAALADALPGDTIKITGTIPITNEFEGVLDGARTGGVAGGWITITSAGSLPPEGTRMTPTLAAMYNIPVLKGMFDGSVLTLRNGVSKVRIIGLDIMVDPSVNTTEAHRLVAFGTAEETSDAQRVKQAILDRSWVHGHPTLDARHAVGIEGSSQAVVDSYIDEIHSSFGDAKGIWGWNGNGPFKVTNTYISAAGEGFGFGGSDPRIAGTIPADIEFRGNHVTKPVTSKRDGWVTKNLIEFKSATRALIEGNVLDNSIGADQAFAIMMYSVNQNGGHNVAETSHVTIRKNELRNCAGTLNVTQGLTATGIGTWVRTHHIAFTHNAAHGMDTTEARYVSGPNIAIQIGQGVDDLSIEHNTLPYMADSTAIFKIGDASSAQTCRRLTIRNNVGLGAVYTIAMYSATGATFANITEGTGVWAGNVIAGTDASYYAGLYGVTAGNSYPTDPNDIGFVGGLTAARSPTAVLSDLALRSDSAYHHAGTDGTDPGADMIEVAAAVAGAA